MPGNGFWQISKYWGLLTIGFSTLKTCLEYVFSCLIFSGLFFRYVFLNRVCHWVLTCLCLLVFIVIRLPSRSDRLSVLEPELRINYLVWLRDNASCQATVSPALKFLDSHALTNVGICPRKSNHSQRLPSSGHLLDVWRKHWNIYFTKGNLHNGVEKKTLGLLWVSCLFFPKTTLQQLLGEPSFRKTLKKLHLPKVQQNLGELLILGGGHQSIDGDVCTVINIYILYI